MSPTLETGKSTKAPQRPDPQHRATCEETEAFKSKGVASLWPEEPRYLGGRVQAFGPHRPTHPWNEVSWVFFWLLVLKSTKESRSGWRNMSRSQAT